MTKLISQNFRLVLIFTCFLTLFSLDQHDCCTIIIKRADDTRKLISWMENFINSTMASNPTCLRPTISDNQLRPNYNDTRRGKIGLQLLSPKLKPLYDSLPIHAVFHVHGKLRILMAR